MFTITEINLSPLFPPFAFIYLHKNKGILQANKMIQIAEVTYSYTHLTMLQTPLVFFQN